MTIQVFSPTLGNDELLAIADSFNSGWIGKGPKVAEFEKAWAAHIGVSPENVCSVSCATEGLFQIMGLADFGVIRGRENVIIPSIHFSGAAQAIISAGGKPVFCDVDKHTLNPTLEHIQAKYQPKQTEAVFLLHYGGVAQELDIIRQWCDEKGLWLIEDAACSPATIFKGKAAGAWGHFGVWSFDAMKIVSCGDGGVVYCENPEHAAILRKRLYLGTSVQSGSTNDNPKWWEFEIEGMGRRAIMNDIAAGIGLEQLKKLWGFIDRRLSISLYYQDVLSEIEEIDLPDYNSLFASSNYFCHVQTSKRDDLAKFLRANGIYTTFRYYPLHRVFKTGDDLPNTDYAADNTLLLPLHCNLSDSDVEFICDKVKEFFK